MPVDFFGGRGAVPVGIGGGRVPVEIGGSGAVPVEVGNGAGVGTVV